MSRLIAHLPFGVRGVQIGSPRGLGNYPARGWAAFEAEQISPLVNMGITRFLPFLPGGTDPTLQPIGLDWNSSIKYSNMLFDQGVKCREVNAAHAEFWNGYIEWCGRARDGGAFIMPYWGKATRWHPASFPFFASMLAEQANVSDGFVFDAMDLNENEWSPGHLAMAWVSTLGKLACIEAGPIRHLSGFLNRSNFGVFSNLALFERRAMGPRGSDYFTINEHFGPVTLFVRGPKGREQGVVSPAELYDQSIGALRDFPTFGLCVSVGNLRTDPSLDLPALVKAAI